MITFRPHHFMCTLGFQGMGYSPGFIGNYQEIVSLLKANPHTDIRVSFSLDSICRACPHQTEEKLCQSQEKIALLDARHAAVLDLNEGEILSWAEGLARIKERMSMEAFHKACAGCSWKDRGVCEEALRRHLDEGKISQGSQSA